MAGRDVLRVLFSIAAAALFGFAGAQIQAAATGMDIHSVGGQTIDEAFYQSFGLFAKALGMASYAMSGLCLLLGIPAAASTPAPTASPEIVTGTAPVTPDGAG